MKKDFFCTSEFLIIGNEIWYVPLGYRYLCCYDLKSKKIKEQFWIPQNRKQRGLYESIKLYKENIIFIPYVADYFLIFHLKERKFEFLAIEPYKSRGIAFYANYIWKNFIYFIPRAREGFAKEDCIIGRLNLETKKIEYCNIQEKKELEIEDTIQGLYRREILADGDKVFLLDAKSGVVEISLIENDYLIKKVNHLYIHKKFSTICKINEEMVCLTDDVGNVTCCDLQGKIYKTIENTIEDFIPIQNNFWYSECFSYSIQYNNIIFLFPSEANKVLQFDVDDMTISEAVFSKEICVEHEKNRYSCGQFSKPYIAENTLFVWNIWNEKLYIVDLNTNIVEVILIEVIMPSEQLRRSYLDWCNESEAMRERSTLYTGVESMINFLPVENNRKELGRANLVGKDVWRKLK